MYPNLKLLQWCDKSTPVMDVLHHLTLCTLAALEQQRKTLLEPDLFELGADGDVQREGEEVFGTKSDNANSIEETDDEDDSDAENEDMDVHARFLWVWEKRMPKLQHEYAMAGFALSVSPDVLWEHAAQPGMLGAKVRQALKFVVKKLHQDSNPNKDTWLMNEDRIMDPFWTKFADFRNLRGVFGVTVRWQGCHVCAGKSHL